MIKINLDKLDNDTLYTALENIVKRYTFKKVGNYIVLCNGNYAYGYKYGYKCEYSFEPDYIGVDYFSINDIYVNIYDDNIHNTYNDDYTEYETIITYDDEMIDRGDAICINDNWYHEDDNKITICEHCNEYTLKENSEELSCGSYVCRECYENYYSPCECCGSVHHQEALYYCEQEGCEYCENCYDEQCNKTSGRLNHYNYKPTPIFYGDIGVKYGIEIECIFNDMKTAIDDLEGVDYIYLKEDSSVSDGMEIVTHPATIEYHKNNLFDLLEIIRKEHGGKSHNYGSVHVHVGRDNFFNDSHFSTFYDLINNYTEFTELIAQRSKSTWAKINPKEGLKSLKDTNNYNGIGRYAAVNINNLHTIEVRIFNGNLRSDRLMKNLEYVDSLLDYSKCSCTNLQNYFNYIKNNKDKYSYLYSYLIEKEVF